MKLIPILRGTINLRHNIFALSSGSLPSAIAIIRISGRDSLEHGKQMMSVTHIRPKQLFYTKLFDEKGDLLDRAMAVYLPGPNTFTGEDTLELFVHGGKATVNAILERIGRFENTDGAKAGEFSRRALLNNKMNIGQVEALGNLLHAETDVQRKQALRGDGIKKLMDPLKDDLIKLLAQFEASIDFAEDVSVGKEKILGESKDLLRELKNLHDRGSKGTLVQDGIKVVLIGRTNVGKSSLLNKLNGQEVALTSNIHGTTRDSIETRLNLNGLLLRLTDTAGIRDNCDDEIEREGMKRSIAKAKEADIVVFVVDGGRVGEVEEAEKFLRDRCGIHPLKNAIVCVNKADLLDPNHKIDGNPQCYSSCLQDNGTDALVKRLSSEALNLIESNSGSDKATLSTSRQLSLIGKAIESLEAFMYEAYTDSAIAGEHLRDCGEAIGEITGNIVSEDILNSIFSTFCIGK
uniref:TrmE-type G domain-containing protein n=1 Tax=Rhabditophanes sp. KR3021 TaxID=114890 RepID=A0AC35TUZ7_9BILA